MLAGIQRMIHTGGPLTYGATLSMMGAAASEWICKVSE